MPFKLQVTGLREAERKLLELGREEWLRDSLKPGAEVLADSVRNYAPGSIKTLVVSKLARNPKVAVAWAAIDMKLARKRPDKRGRIARYPYFVEYGVGAHTIKTVNLKALRLKGGRFAETVNHPGFTGLKYFARGVRAGRGRAKQLIEANISSILRRLENSSGLAA